MLGFACFQNLIVAAVARHSLKSTQCVSGIVLNGGMALSVCSPLQVGSITSTLAILYGQTLNLLFRPKPDHQEITS